MAVPFLQDAVSVYAVGPVVRRGRWKFFCPLCDDDVIRDVGDAPTKVCTTAWLRARQLEWADREWSCWEEDPLEHLGDGAEARSKKRFWHYSAIARELGARRRRVEHTDCVQEKINELFGDSEVGFHDGSQGQEAQEAGQQL